MKKIVCPKPAPGIIFFLLFIAIGTGESSSQNYQQVAGLIDLRTDYSDGSHNLDFLIQLAKKRGFEALFINDHDRIVMEYGLFPFRNIIKKRVELNSINKGGAKGYLDSIREAEKRHPDMIIVPGSETASFYYWSGSPFSKDLTAHNHERRILTIGMECPEDYDELPILHNGFSTRYLSAALPAILSFLASISVAFFLIRWRGICRITGIIMIVLNVAAIANSNFFRSSPFDQYHGDQGIAPYQLLIDYVNSKGGMTFWNYPETNSGVRQEGPILVSTLPYPDVLLESSRYTGFASLYGDRITITEPGNLWDMVLADYCNGKRDRPPFGISTADFHEEGGAGEKLGNFPTIFFVQKKTKQEVQKALRNGRMYACRGNYPRIAKLDEFSVSSPEGKVMGISGDDIKLKGSPKIKVSISAFQLTEKHVKIRLIRSGEVIKRMEGSLPMEIDYLDDCFKPGEKVFYRMDLHGHGTLISNPIFVEFAK